MPVFDEAVTLSAATTAAQAADQGTTRRTVVDLKIESGGKLTVKVR